MHNSLHMTPQEKHEFIITALSRAKINYIRIETLESLDKIYNLFANNDVTAEPETGEEYNYYGIYHEHIKKDITLAKTYYLQAVEHKDSNGMNNLAWIYAEVEHDFDKSKHFYMMAIEHGNTTGMCNLANYYGKVEKDFVKLEKYYRIAIDYGDIHAIKHLATWCEIQNKWTQAFELYMLDPIKYEIQIAKLFERPDVLQLFLLKHQVLIKKNQDMSIEISQLKLQVEHLRFKPGREGAKQAKEHFESLIS